MFNLKWKMHQSQHSHSTPGQEVTVTVRGGYSPDTIRSEVGEPLRIVFLRKESAPCSEQVVFPDFGKSLTLPEGKRVSVDLLPSEPGIYSFHCAMNLLQGELIISPCKK